MSFSVFVFTAENIVIAAEKTALSVTWYAFPPSLVMKQGMPTGPTIDRMTKILKKAGIAPAWIMVTMGQEKAMLDDGRRPFCTTGRTYTKARAAKWSMLPHLFEKHPGDLLLAHHSVSSDISKYKKLRALLDTKHFTASFAKNVTYGDSTLDIFEQKNKKSYPWILTVAPTEHYAAKMVAAGRADYTIMEEGQWHIFKDENTDYAKLLRPLPQFDTLKSTELFITCSKTTPSALLNKIEHAMHDLGYEKINRQ